MHIVGGGGILLNAKKIGNYCGFNAGVLLGNKDNVENKPTIGDYVAFGPGSKAFGEITIGTNVFIAPNAVVTKDVPNNVTVGGIPAKIISNKGPWDIDQDSTTPEEAV
jgi:serine O-acetyltransferase